MSRCSKAVFPGPRPHARLSLWLCPRPAAQTPGASGLRGAEPAVRGEEARRCRAEPSWGLAVPSSRELRWAPAAGPVRPPQSPDPRPARRRAGAAGEGPVRLQLELLRPTLRKAAGGAARQPRPRRRAGLSAEVRP